VQFCELGPDLGLVLARDFLAPPLAVRAGLETDHATPAAQAMSVGLRVAALPRVIEVDAVFAPATPGCHGPQPYRLADHLATGMAPIAIAMKINIVADLVGDTGIEPVTSSV